MMSGLTEKMSRWHFLSDLPVYVNSLFFSYPTNFFPSKYSKMTFTLHISHYDNMYFLKIIFSFFFRRPNGNFSVQSLYFYLRWFWLCCREMYRISCLGPCSTVPSCSSLTSLSFSLKWNTSALNLFPWPAIRKWFLCMHRTGETRWGMYKIYV